MSLRPVILSAVLILAAMLVGAILTEQGVNTLVTASRGAAVVALVSVLAVGPRRT